MRARRIGSSAVAIMALAGLTACGSKTVAAGPSEPASPAPSVTPGPNAGPSADPTADQALLPTDTPSATAATGGPWKLVWSDEFNGSSLGSDWASRPTSAAAGRTCATTVPAMGTVSDGYAKISIAPDSNGPAVDPKICPTGRYYNAQFATQSTKSFTFGKFEARIKYQHAEGLHGSFWLQTIGPAAGAAADDPAQTGTEIDVSEYFGDDFGPGEGNGDYHAYVYWPQKQADGTIKSVKTGGAQDFKKYDSGLPSDGYHVYSVEWTPTEYIFRLDGVETSRVTVGVSHRPEFLQLSLLTSDWEIPKLLPENKNASMSVDWVRVYQR
jgi:beta-glucanase (GH16 family)